MAADSDLTPERFQKSRGYRRARGLQVALMVSFPLTVVIGTFVGYVVGAWWTLWALVTLAGLQVGMFLFAELWKTVVFGRDAFREARRLRSMNRGRHGS